MRRRSRVRMSSSIVRRLSIALLICAATSRAHASPETADVVVYGGTPSGIISAVEAARRGQQVLVVEPSHHIGGIISGGLTKTDIGRRETIGGLPAEFFSRILSYYEKTYGKNSTQANATKGGLFFEPHVAELTFEAMLNEAKVSVLKDRTITDIALKNGHLESIQVQEVNHPPISIKGKIF